MLDVRGRAHEVPGRRARPGTPALWPRLRTEGQAGGVEAGPDRRSWSKGDVELKANDGLVANAARATYESADETVRVPGRVTFSAEPHVGQCQRRDVRPRPRHLLDAGRRRGSPITPDERGGGGTDMTSGAATFARRDRYIRFENAMKLVREGQLRRGRQRDGLPRARPRTACRCSSCAATRG